MCYRPVRIKNTRINFRPGLDKEYIYVPCNHCAECRQQKQNEWYVRLAYERDELVRRGGAVYFITLTHNNRSIPRFDSSKIACLQEYHNVDMSQFDGHFVFDKLELLAFLKHLRQVFKEKYNVDGLKYFFVSELGTDDNHTHRTHYHGYLFSPIKFQNPQKLLGIFNYCWSDRVKIGDYPDLVVSDRALSDSFERGFYYQNNDVIVRQNNGCAGVTYHLRKGFCSWSKDPESKEYRPEIVNNLGLKYAMKYLDKDDLFMGFSISKDIEFVLSKCPSISDLEEKKELCDKDFYQSQIDAIRYLKNCLPFHVQSSKIGISLVQQFGNTYSYSDLVQKNKIPVTSDSNMYFIPQYVLRHLLYTDDFSFDRLQMGYEPRGHVLNELGYKVAKEQLLFRVLQKTEQYEHILSSKFISRYHSLPSDRKVNVNINHLREFSAQYSQEIAYYEIIFRGVYGLFPKDFHIDKKYIPLYADELMSAKLDSDSFDFQYDGIHLYKCFGDGQVQYFDELPFFKDCEKFLSDIYAIRKCVLDRHYELKEEERLKKIKDRKVHSSVINN